MWFEAVQGAAQVRECLFITIRQKPTTKDLNYLTVMPVKLHHVDLKWNVPIQHLSVQTGYLKHFDTICSLCPHP